MFSIPDSIGRDIEKSCQSTYPLHDVYIRKVKVLKKPKFDSEFNSLKMSLQWCSCSVCTINHQFVNSKVNSKVGTQV